MTIHRRARLASAAAAIALLGAVAVPAAGASAQLNLAPTSGAAGSIVHATYKWVACGANTSTLWIDFYWDTDATVLAGLPVTPNGVGDCELTKGLVVPAGASEGPHEVIGRLRDEKGDAIEVSVAKATFTVVAASQPPLPTKPPAATEPPKATQSPVKGTQLPAAPTKAPVSTPPPPASSGAIQPEVGATKEPQPVAGSPTATTVAAPTASEDGGVAPGGGVPAPDPSAAGGPLADAGSVTGDTDTPPTTEILVLGGGLVLAVILLGGLAAFGRPAGTGGPATSVLVAMNAPLEVVPVQGEPVRIAPQEVVPVQGEPLPFETEKP